MTFVKLNLIFYKRSRFYGFKSNRSLFCWHRNDVWRSLWHGFRLMVLLTFVDMKLSPFGISAQFAQQAQASRISIHSLLLHFVRFDKYVEGEEMTIKEKAIARRADNRRNNIIEYERAYSLITIKSLVSSNSSCVFPGEKTKEGWSLLANLPRVFGINECGVIKFGYLSYQDTHTHYTNSHGVWQRESEEKKRRQAIKLIL